jgi:hypothetical protein
MTESPKWGLTVGRENPLFMERQKVYQVKINWLAELLGSSNF